MALSAFSAIVSLALLSSAGSISDQDHQRALLRKEVNHLLSEQQNPGKCLDAKTWKANFSKQPFWRKNSQWNQDAVLASLFSPANLGTTNKLFVEFGFPDHDMNTSYGNSRTLMENFGFKPALLLDGASDNPSINLHKRFVTADTIVSMFKEFNVDWKPDYVSVDIDSCDLWVFFALTEVYRPRVVTVEYNSRYAFGDYTTLKCADPKAPNAYSFNASGGGDNLYGASLSAIELAAQRRGYSLVYVTTDIDLFFVPSELVCPGTAVPVTDFKADTSHSHFVNLDIKWPAYNGHLGPEADLVTDFRQWLDENGR